MKKTFGLIITFLYLLALCSCSTIYNSGSQSILAKSSNDIEGVKIEVATPAGAYQTKLPATIAAEPSHNGVKIRVIDKCYDNTNIEVVKSITPSFWANFLWLGLFPVGMTVDAISGKMWKYDGMVVIPVNEKEDCNKKS